MQVQEKEDFTVEDYTILATYVKNKYDKNVQLKEQPTWGEFARLIAQIGGSSLQKDRPLGVPSLWKGFRKYYLIKETYNLFKKDGGKLANPTLWKNRTVLISSN